MSRLGTTADPQRDRILIDGRPLAPPETFVYLLLHKPVGVVSTLKDPQSRPTVRDLLRDVHERVFPVGRLDYHSAGLLLLTNDGALTERLLHPRYQMPRTYRAKLTGMLSTDALAALRQGVRLDDGVVSAPAEVHIIRKSANKTWIEITLREGRNREVRRMCEAVGHRVEKLLRTRFGPLLLADLPTGAYRSLNQAEVRELKRAAGLSRSPS